MHKDQIADVEISIIFDTAFRGGAIGAVWIVGSHENREWFNRQTNLDISSAVFTPEGGEIGQAAILRSVWNVQEHYADWSMIDVRGVALMKELSDKLSADGKVTATGHGFALARP